MQDQIKDFEAAAQRTATAAANYRAGPTHLQHHLRKSMHRDDTESVLSETTDRDVVCIIYLLKT